MYHFGILIGAAVMLLLPLIYVGLIVLAGLAIYWHAVNDVVMIQSVRGRATIVMAFLYIIPIVSGVVLVLFMIKPLFARPSQQGRTRSLTRKGEPLLFDFVDKLCDTVHAPRPKQINVDCQVNASASFRRGLLSMFGSDLVLTIGLPLVAGLNMQQFAGVVAHEFGHFTQGFGMRLSYVTRSISMWFTRVVYERDAWDDRLIEWSHDSDLRFGVFFYVARGCVWLTRQLLWVLMMIGHVASGFLLKQMEFDADRHQARLVGASTLEAMLIRIHLLGVAMDGAQSDLGAFFREGRLGDNLPKLIMVNFESMPAEVRKLIERQVRNQSAGLLDSHPSPSSRIAKANADNPGRSFHCELPASALFEHYDKLCQNVTWDFYRTVLGPRVKPDDLSPIDELLDYAVKERETSNTGDRYFQGAFHPLRPLRLPSGYIEPPTEKQELVQQIDSNRAVIEAQRNDYSTLLEKFDNAQQRAALAEQARALAGSRISFDASEFLVREANTVAAAQSKRQSANTLEQLSDRMSTFEEAVGHRVYASLQLLQSSSVAAKLDAVRQLQDLSDTLVRCVTAMNASLPSYLALRNSYAGLSILITHFEKHRTNEMYIDEFTRFMRETLRLVTELRTTFSRVEYPFDHARGKLSITSLVAEDSPVDDDFGEIYNTADSMLAGLLDVYQRTVAKLGEVAEKVETTVGFQPLATLDVEEDSGSTA
jgi:hypothetical protein